MPNTQPHSASGHGRRLPHPFRSSIQACRDAALQISRIGSQPTFKIATNTYVVAVSFISLHLFTAAVVLCIMTSLEPMSHEAHEAKIGVRRLMELQSRTDPLWPSRVWVY
jgi:hypothetical protein